MTVLTKIRRSLLAFVELNIPSCLYSTNYPLDWQVFERLLSMCKSKYVGFRELITWLAIEYLMVYVGPYEALC